MRVMMVMMAGMVEVVVGVEMAVEVVEGVLVIVRVVLMVVGVVVAGQVMVMREIWLMRPGGGRWTGGSGRYGECGGRMWRRMLLRGRGLCLTGIMGEGRSLHGLPGFFR